MKFLGFDSILMVFAGIFGLVGGSFLSCPQFSLHWKAVMVAIMFAVIVFCTIIQRHFNDLDVKTFARAIFITKNKRS